MSLNGLKTRYSIFVFYHSGNQTLYWSFDTLDNLTTMERSQQINFDPLVPGKVDMQNFFYVSICEYIYTGTFIFNTFQHDFSIWFHIFQYEPFQKIV